MSESKNILFQVSGSIACYKSCDLVSKLVGQGHNVKCVMTEDAVKFIGPVVFEGLTGNKVFRSIYEEGRMMDHIHLNEWADLVITHPATANTINSMAAGVASNIISNLYLSFPFNKSHILFPAMNHKMLNHPTTKKSLESLKEHGLIIAPTSEGNLACGETGHGRLLETTESLNLLKDFL